MNSTSVLEKLVRKGRLLPFAFSFVSVVFPAAAGRSAMLFFSTISLLLRTADGVLN